MLPVAPKETRHDRPVAHVVRIARVKGKHVARIAVHPAHIAICAREISEGRGVYVIAAWVVAICSGLELIGRDE